jgi:predicted phosphodiesterase
MRVLIIADIHGNLPALKAVLAHPHDMLICLGDMVGYGPEPGACVRRILAGADLIVRGNHEQALVTGAVSGCPSSLQWLADTTAPLGEAQVSAGDQAAIAELPVRASYTIDGIHYDLTHAAPSDPLHRYLDPAPEAWAREARASTGEVVLVPPSNRPNSIFWSSQRTYSNIIVGYMKRLGVSSVGDTKAAAKLTTGCAFVSVTISQL